jgi:hypothetical protein
MQAKKATKQFKMDRLAYRQCLLTFAVQHNIEGILNLPPPSPKNRMHRGMRVTTKN